MYKDYSRIKVFSYRKQYCEKVTINKAPKTYRKEFSSGSEKKEKKKKLKRKAQAKATYSCCDFNPISRNSSANFPGWVL